MRPRVIMSNAVSIDGRIDGFAADLGLYYGLTGRWGANAHLVGSNTLLKSGAVAGEGAAEAPPEPRRLDPTDTRTLLVVPDSRGRVRNWHALRCQPYWRDVVVLVARRTPATYRAYLERTEVDSVEAGDEWVDLAAALAALYERYEVRTVHLDSGGTLNGIMLQAGLVDELHLLVHPELVGGAPNSIYNASALPTTLKAQLMCAETLDNGIVWLSYALEKGGC